MFLNGQPEVALQFDLILVLPLKGNIFVFNPLDPQFVLVEAALDLLGLAALPSGKVRNKSSLLLLH